MITDAPPPGALGRIVALHADWYARHWGFGLPFEAKVAAELGAFAAGLPQDRSRLFTALDAAGQVQGAIALDGRAWPVARLRWFIVAEASRGGLGRLLLDKALDAARAQGCTRIWLTTFAGLDAARRLYERAGFVLESEAPEEGWGVRVTGQVYALRLDTAAAQDSSA